MQGRLAQNLAQILDDNAAAFPGKTCLIYEDIRFTYQELNKLVNKAGNAFLDLGIKKGDRVIISLLNNPEFVISLFALAKTGAIMVPVNYQLTAAEEDYILKDSQPSLIITDAVKLSRFHEMTAGAIPVLTINRHAGEEVPSEILDFWDQISAQSDSLSPCPCGPDDVVHILYTSGTTGKPKGAMLTHHSVLFCSSFYTDNDEMGTLFSSDSKFLVTLPIYHCYGQNFGLITPLAVGATVILMDKFNTEKVFEAIAEHGVTNFPGVPTMYAYLVNGFDPERHSVKSLKFCKSAGASLSLEIRTAFREKFGIEISEGFGMTEASAQAIAHPVGADKQRGDKIGSIGIPLRNNRQQTEAKIVDEDDRELGPNEVGELIIKGDHVMKGYWKQPEETAKTLRGGWLHTGDLARKDEDGFIYIVDRKKDMIIVGGENVYPREIEEVLYQNDKVLDAAVIGMKDAIKGEVVKAVVVLKEGMQGTENELIDFCAARLAKFKVPRAIEIREEMPKSSTGKILRRLVR
ncbi:MAG: long-chain fatty acid--CoA ligase [Syntrophobacteraceae bacterium]|jgi:long-chain acyl-CoA synthetase